MFSDKEEEVSPLSERECRKSAMIHLLLGGNIRVSPSQRPASYSEVRQHRKVRLLSRAFCFGVVMARERKNDGTFNVDERKQRAIRLGETHYMPSSECKNGHLAKRFVSNNGCSECLKVGVRKYQAKNRAILLVKKSEWAKKNPEKNREQSVKWYRENTEKAIRLNKISKKKNLESSLLAGRRAASKRRAALMYRIPKWADLDAIRKVYDLCPLGMVVDHIIPLQGKIVSGLHVHQNLQYLSFSDNAKKGARFDG